MTHEPEYQKADLGCGQYPCVEVCICEYLRAAYRRGREDAPTAMIHVGWWTLAKWVGRALRAERKLAARGDGA